jgi:hypothetical protein
MPNRTIALSATVFAEGALIFFLAVCRSRATYCAPAQHALPSSKALSEFRMSTRCSLLGKSEPVKRRADSSCGGFAGASHFRWFSRKDLSKRAVPIAALLAGVFDKD